jgi:4-aminobutyrate aminotransferase-like enzyme
VAASSTDHGVEPEGQTVHLTESRERRARERLLTCGVASGPRIVAGQGVSLTLDDGREVLDAMTTPAPLGHRHPRIVEAVVSAARSSPTLDEGWSTQLREELVDELFGTALEGEDWVGAARFALTGSEANDLALSLSQALTGRRPVVTRERAYHGMVGLSRDVTVQPQWHGGLTSRSGGVRPVPRAAEVRTLPYPRTSLGDGLDYPAQAAAALLADADEALSDAAAVIVDYTQGGFYAAPTYQDVIARKARGQGTLWIADEVITGFGKSGDVWFNFQRGDERPDLVTLGKPFGGGLVPFAGVVVSRAVLDDIGDSAWQNYSSLRSNDIGAAAARAFIRVVDEDGLVKRAGHLHHRIAAGVRGLTERHPSITRADGRGLHWWIELGDQDWRDWRGDGEEPIASRVAAKVLDAGAFIATSAERSALIMTLAMVVSDEHVDAVLAALDHGLDFADRTLGS